MWQQTSCDTNEVKTSFQKLTLKTRVVKLLLIGENEKIALSIEYLDNKIFSQNSM